MDVGTQLQRHVGFPSMLDDIGVGEGVALHPLAVRTPGPRELDPQEPVGTLRFLEPPPHSRPARRSVRAPPLGPNPGSLRRLTHPRRCTDRQRHDDDGGAMGGVTSSISLVRRRTRDVGIEGARQNAAHSFHGDATRQARAGQTLGCRITASISKIHIGSRVAAAPPEKSDGRRAAMSQSDFRKPAARTVKARSVRSGTLSVEGSSRSTGCSQGDWRLEQFAEEGDLAELARRGEHDPQVVAGEGRPGFRGGRVGQIEGGPLCDLGDGEYQSE